MGALAGFLSTMGGGGSEMRLHALVKDYCEKRRFAEDPERKRTTPSFSADRGGHRGGVRLWLEQGLEALRAVDALLTDGVLSAHPRLALVRCVVLASADDIEGAKRVYGAAAAATPDFTRDRAGGGDGALRTEHIFVEGLLHMCGCVPYRDGILPAIAGAQAVADAAETDPLLRGVAVEGTVLTGDHPGQCRPIPPRDEGGTLIPLFANYVMAHSKKIAHADEIAGNLDLDGPIFAYSVLSSTRGRPSPPPHQTPRSHARAAASATA